MDRTCSCSPSIFWLWMREHLQRKSAELKLSFVQEQSQRIPSLEAALKKKEEECHIFLTNQTVAEEKLLMLQQAEEQLKNAFHALSSEALEKNNRSFLDLAKDFTGKISRRSERGFG